MSTELNIVWGCAAIAKCIGRTERQTFHMLENGTLPGAKKVGGRWCFSPDIFAAATEDDSDRLLLAKRAIEFQAKQTAKTSAAIAFVRDIERRANTLHSKSPREWQSFITAARRFVREIEAKGTLGALYGDSDD